MKPKPYKKLVTEAIRLGWMLKSLNIKTSENFPEVLTNLHAAYHLYKTAIDEYAHYAQGSRTNMDKINAAKEVMKDEIKDYPEFSIKFHSFETNAEARNIKDEPAEVKYAGINITYVVNILAK